MIRVDQGTQSPRKGVCERHHAGLQPPGQADRQCLRGNLQRHGSARVPRTPLVLELDDAREKVEEWRTEHDEVRPHSPIGDRTPLSLIPPPRQHREAISDKFPKHIYHSIVCIGALIAHREPDHWAVDAPRGDRTEKELITAFCDKIPDLSPQLVKFNGNNFDLRYRAMVHGVSAPGRSYRNGRGVVLGRVPFFGALGEIIPEWWRHHLGTVGERVRP
jgi:hypothetical protein